MKKIMLIGESGAGKTTLVQALLGKKIKYKKTQSLNFYDYILDTPGEYLENRRYYNSLLVSSAKYDIIGLVQDSTSKRTYYPPKFASMFSKDKQVIGIITKIDSEDSNKPRAEKFLKTAGVNTIFRISAMMDEGIDEIRNFLMIEED